MEPFLDFFLDIADAALIIFYPHDDFREQPHSDAEFLSTLEHVTSVVGGRVMLPCLF